MVEIRHADLTATSNPAATGDIIEAADYNTAHVITDDDGNPVTLQSSVTPQQFGAVADGTTDDSAAFVAAIAYLKTIAINDDVFYKGSPRLFVPTGDYYLGTTTLDITHTLIIEGESSNNGYGSRLTWADNTTGIRLQAHNTNGASGEDGSPFHYSGAGTIIRNLGLVGGVYGSETGLSGSEAEYHGIHLRTSGSVQDCYINGFRGDGIHCLASAGGGGADEGNANNAYITRVRVTNVRNGIFVDGADANAWLVQALNATYCRQWAVYDSSFLGNTYIGLHSANAGLVPGVPPNQVENAGRWYAVRAGQAVGASTNSPSGTSADNTWWLHIGVAAANPTLNVSAWLSGTTYRDGGSYKTDSANGYNVFINCYSEGGEAPAQFVLPTLAVGGLWGTRNPVTTGNRISGDVIEAPNPASFGLTTAAYASGGGADKIITAHNKSALAAGTPARLNLSQGYEADGVTPCRLVDIYAESSGSNPATNEGTWTLAVRAAGGTMTDRLKYSAAFAVFYPANNNATDLGGSSNHWKDAYVQTVKVANTKVLGAQGAAVADATDAASTMARLNDLLARLRTHGLIAT